MKLSVNKNACSILENEIWNVGDYNVHTVEVELSSDFDGLVNKVRYFVDEECYDMPIEDNVAKVPYEATKEMGTIKIGVYGFDASTDILVQSTTPVKKFITCGTYTGEADNTEPLTPTDKQIIEQDIQNLKDNKQDKLVSGVNIKTINNESLLGEGNIDIQGGGGSSDYNELENKPSINNVELVGNKTLEDLGIFSGNFEDLTNLPFILIDEDTSMDIVNEAYPGKILLVTKPITFGLDDVDESSIELTEGNMIIVGEEYYDNFLICSYGYIQAMISSGKWKYEFVATTDWVEGSFQPILVSGYNIKTINNQSILGSGNLNIDVALPWAKLNEDINIEDLENGSYVAVEDIVFTYGDSTYDVMALNAGDFISIADAQAIVVSSYGFYTLNNVSGVWYADPNVGYKEFNDAIDYINNQLNNKQDELTAGTGITITNNVISANVGISIEVVQTLPQTGQEQVIYLVPNGETTPNFYDEYIWVNNAFEKIGTTQIDLSNYYTKAETNTLLNNKQNNLTAGQNVTISNDTISAGIEVLEI